MIFSLVDGGKGARVSARNNKPREVPPLQNEADTEIGGMKGFE
jgi:hypothetical protein